MTAGAFVARFFFLFPDPLLPLGRGCFLVVSLTYSLDRRGFLLRILFLYTFVAAAGSFGFVSRTRQLTAGAFLFCS